jgi:hypothetical protein
VGLVSAEQGSLAFDFGATGAAAQHRLAGVFGDIQDHQVTEGFTWFQLNRVGHELLYTEFLK